MKIVRGRRDTGSERDTLRLNPNVLMKDIMSLTNKDKIILHLCADTGSDSLPYREAGYDVRCIGKAIGVENFHPPENVYGIIANPPCTMFSIARTRAKTPRDLREGMKLVTECLRIIWEARFKNKLAFWVIENPRGYLRQFLGKPAMTFMHCHFGDEGGKPTDLWGYFNFPRKLFPCAKPARGKFNTESAWYNKFRSPEKRSLASPKFAQAFFEVNQ